MRYETSGLDGASRLVAVWGLDLVICRVSISISGFSSLIHLCSWCFVYAFQPPPSTSPFADVQLIITPCSLHSLYFTLFIQDLNYTPETVYPPISPTAALHGGTEKTTPQLTSASRSSSERRSDRRAEEWSSALKPFTPRATSPAASPHPLCSSAAKHMFIKPVLNLLWAENGRQLMGWAVCQREGVCLYICVCCAFIFCHSNICNGRGHSSSTLSTCAHDQRADSKMMSMISNHDNGVRNVHTHTLLWLSLKRHLFGVQTQLSLSVRRLTQPARKKRNRQRWERSPWQHNNADTGRSKTMKNCIKVQRCWMLPRQRRDESCILNDTRIRSHSR